jgi:hypothetical protein
VTTATSRAARKVAMQSAVIISTTAPLLRPCEEMFPDAFACVSVCSCDAVFNCIIERGSTGTVVGSPSGQGDVSADTATIHSQPQIASSSIFAIGLLSSPSLDSITFEEAMLLVTRITATIIYPAGARHLVLYISRTVS